MAAAGTAYSGTTRRGSHTSIASVVSTTTVPWRDARSRFCVLLHRSCDRPRNHCWCMSSAMAQPCAATGPGGNGAGRTRVSARAAGSTTRARRRTQPGVEAPRHGVVRVHPERADPVLSHRRAGEVRGDRQPQPVAPVGGVHGDPREDRVARHTGLAHPARDQPAARVADPDPVLSRVLERARVGAGVCLGQECLDLGQVTGDEPEQPRLGSHLGRRGAGAQPLPLAAVTQRQQVGDGGERGPLDGDRARSRGSASRSSRVLTRAPRSCAGPIISSPSRRVWVRRGSTTARPHAHPGSSSSCGRS